MSVCSHNSLQSDLQHTHTYIYINKIQVYKYITTQSIAAIRIIKLTSPNNPSSPKSIWNLHGTWILRWLLFLAVGHVQMVAAKMAHHNTIMDAWKQSSNFCQQVHDTVEACLNHSFSTVCLTVWCWCWIHESTSATSFQIISTTWQLFFDSASSMIKTHRHIVASHLRIAVSSPMPMPLYRRCSFNHRRRVPPSPVTVDWLYSVFSVQY